MQHGKTQVVPELWIAAQRRACLLKVAERLQIFLVFVEGKTKVVENLCCTLRVQRAEVLMRRLLIVAVSFSSSLATITSATLALSLCKRLSEAFSHNLQLILFSLAASARSSCSWHIDCDVLGHFKELESL